MAPPLRLYLSTIYRLHPWMQHRRRIAETGSGDTPTAPICKPFTATLTTVRQASASERPDLFVRPLLALTGTAANPAKFANPSRLARSVRWGGLSRHTPQQKPVIWVVVLAITEGTERRRKTLIGRLTPFRLLRLAGGTGKPAKVAKPKLRGPSRTAQSIEHPAAFPASCRSICWPPAPSSAPTARRTPLAIRWWDLELVFFDLAGLDGVRLY